MLKCHNIEHAILTNNAIIQIARVFSALLLNSYHLNPAVVRTPRTLRHVQIQGGTRISAQVYWLYIEHEIRESDAVDVHVLTFACQITAGFIIKKSGKHRLRANFQAPEPAPAGDSRSLHMAGYDRLQVSEITRLRGRAPIYWIVGKTRLKTYNQLSYNQKFEYFPIPRTPLM